MEQNQLLDQLPAPNGRNVAVRVTESAESVIRRGHPWLFDAAITSLSHAAAAGDLAIIFDRKRRFLAVGLYDPASPIRVKVLHSGSPVTIDEAWFEARIAAAVAVRAPLVAAGTNGMRLVNGENDGLPGLILDRYADSLVLKLYTAAWLPHLRAVLAALARVWTDGAPRLVLRLSRQLQNQALFGLSDGMALWGAPPTEPVLFLENGFTFEADVIDGQKTGFFLDQRENRQRAGAMAHGKRVLDVFACTGGFSVYAAHGGARHVISVDSSAAALAAAQRNMAHNRLLPRVAAAQHDIIVGDAFETLAELGREGRRFDVIVIDPPSFAQRQHEVDRALKAYARLVQLGLGALQSGGTLVMASCSSRVSAESFFDTVRSTARSAGRPLREIERTGHALDHPVTFPEGAYLKCLFAQA